MSVSKRPLRRRHAWVLSWEKRVNKNTNLKIWHDIFSIALSFNGPIVYLFQAGRCHTSLKTFHANPSGPFLIILLRIRQKTKHNTTKKKKTTQTHTESEKTNITVTAHNVCVWFYFKYFKYKKSWHSVALNSVLSCNTVRANVRQSGSETKMACLHNNCIYKKGGSTQQHTQRENSQQMLGWTPAHTRASIHKLTTSSKLS